MTFTNPFGAPGQWFKANLHTHSTCSDGDVSPEVRAVQYRKAGYNVLAITDHRTVTILEGDSPEGLLLITSLEAHPPCPGASLYHFVCLDVPADFDYNAEMPAQDMIDSVRASGGEVIFAHPYWCGHSAEHIRCLDGLIGVEVYNATCTKIGKGDSSVIWDYLLAGGTWLPAVAVDDVHRDRDIFMGWTMIKASELSREAVMDALRSGCYYASSGPTIEDFRLEGARVTLRCSPAREIHFMCRCSTGRCFYAEDGPPLTSAEAELTVSAGYVRAQVVDELGRRAWTNPIAFE